MRDAPQLSRPWLHVGLRPAPRRLRHEDGPRADAHLEARRLRRGAGPGRRAARRRPHELRLPRGPALLPDLQRRRRGGVRAPDADRASASSRWRSPASSWRGSATSSACSPTRASSTWASSSSASASAARPSSARSCTWSTTASPRACSSSPPATSTAPTAASAPTTCAARSGACRSSGALFLAGFFAITGSPPFGPFVSEFTILRAAIERRTLRRRRRSSSLLLVVIFIGMGATVLAVVQGEPPERPSAPTGFRDTASHRGAGDRVARRWCSCSASTSRRRSTRSLHGRRGVRSRCSHDDCRRRCTTASGSAARSDPAPAISTRSAAPSSTRRRAAGASSALFGQPARDDAVELVVVLAADEEGIARGSRARSSTATSYPVAHAGLPAGAPVRARDRRAVGRRARRPSVAQAGPLPPLDAPGSRRLAAPPRRERPSSASPTSTASRARRSTRSRSGRSTPASSSPGHFRFQCHGEHVFHLEISLGYQHRGVERALVGGPDKRTIHYMETLAGDTTDRSRDRLLPGRRGARRRPRVRPRAHGAARRSRSSSSASPTTSAISARSPATSASCRPRPTAAACAATS